MFNLIKKSWTDSTAAALTAVILALGSEKNINTLCTAKFHKVSSDQDLPYDLLYQLPWGPPMIAKIYCCPNSYNDG